MVSCPETSPVLAYAFVSEVPGWVGSFAGNLARLLANARSGTSVLWQQAHTLAVPTLRPGSGESLELVGAGARGLPGAVERRWLSQIRPRSPMESVAYCAVVPVDPSGMPPDDEPRTPARLGGFAPSDRSARTGSGPAGPFELPRLPPVPLGVGADLQTFWIARGDGNLNVRFRCRVSTPRGPASTASQVFGAQLKQVLRQAGFPLSVLVPLRPSGWAEEEWSQGRLRWAKGGPAFAIRPEDAARAVFLGEAPRFPDRGHLTQHTIVLGASGSGKTSFLARVAREEVERGGATVVVDVHGDLTRRVLDGLSDAAALRTVVLDPTDRSSPGPGFRLLGSDDESSGPANAAHLVAALKRLTGDSGETFWGFRLERIFDTFVRLVQEESGTLLDLFDLLTDPRRREAARLTTRIPEVARFLDELPSILGRNPEFLAPAAARVAKVALRPDLARLLAPEGDGLPAEELLDGGRSILLRLPIGDLGPEASSLAASLLTTHLYLGRTRSAPSGRSSLRTLFVLDEAHSVSPRLLTEMLSEGRKFGVGVVLATQYPERLSPELRAAAVGAAGTHLLFRVPRGAAVAAGSWVGLPPAEALEMLPRLPVAVAVLSTPASGDPRRLFSFPPEPLDPPSRLPEAVRRTSSEFATAGTSMAARPDLSVDESILFEVLASEAAGRPADDRSVVASVASAPDKAFDPAATLGRIPTLVRRGWLERGPDGQLTLSPAGVRVLGADGRTGASRESAEHRALLVGAFRRFAARGYRLEILRQGRFDTRLPDARLRLLPARSFAASPRSLAAEVDRARLGWAWRFFVGRDVYVEAEVSGALRRARIRHGVAKARAAGAFALFLVGDAPKARRVRELLREEHLVPDRAQVWTLPEGRSGLENRPAPALL